MRLQWFFFGGIRKVKFGDFVNFPHSCPLTDARWLIKHCYTFKPEETLNKQNKTIHTAMFLVLPPKRTTIIFFIDLIKVMCVKDEIKLKYIDTSQLLGDYYESIFF